MDTLRSNFGKLLLLLTTLLLITIIPACQDKSGKRGTENAEYSSKASTASASSEDLSKIAQKVLIYPVPEPPCAMPEFFGVSLSPLRILLIGPTISNTSVGSKVKSGITIEPAVPGSWTWTGTNEISFRPESDWVVKSYRVVLDRALLPESFSLINYELQFNPRGSCINTHTLHLPYRITAPKLPSRVTDAIPDQLLITFDRAVAPSEMIERAFTDQISSTPAIAGEWKWISDRALVFLPKDPWAPGTNYQLNFTPAVFAKDAVIPGYVYRFSTPQSNIERARSSYQVTAPAAPLFEANPKPQELFINFSEPVAPSELIDKVLPQKILDTIVLQPALEGAWSWSSDKSLRFVPAKHWQAGKTYTLGFSSEIFGDSKPEKTYRLTFYTPAITTRFSNQALYIDPEDPNIKRIVATVTISHPLDKSEFEKHIALQLEPRGEKTFPDGKGAINYGFTVTYGEFGREAYISSDPIVIPESDAQMRILLLEGSHTILGIPETTSRTSAVVYVPSRENYFRVESVSAGTVPNARHGNDQVLVISTTAGIKGEENTQNISSYLLPATNKHAATDEKDSDAKPYIWEDPNEITAEVLSRSTPVNLQLIPTAEQFSKQLSFKFDADIDRQLFISVKDSLKSVDGYRLGKEHKELLFLGAAPKAIQILSNGSLLSLTGERKLSIMTRDVKKIEIEVSRLLPNTVNHFISQTAGAFQKPWFRFYDLSADDLSERLLENREFSNLRPGEVNYSAIDLSSFLAERAQSPRGLFLLRIKEVQEAKKAVNPDPDEASHIENVDEYGDDGEESYEERSSGELAQDQRIILVTDLGLLVKKNQNGTQDLFVQSLKTGTPVEGAVVKVLGKNGLPLHSVTTTREGHVTFPNLLDFTREKTPIVYTVEKGGDFSFIPYNRDDRRLNLSRFDVGGLESQSDAPGVQAYLFSDRGVFRPGDDINLGVVVKSDDWVQDLLGLPLELVLTDPRGMEIRKEPLLLGRFGFNELSHHTEETSPTGRYQFSLFVKKDGKRKSVLGSTSVRVEEFFPDRMTIFSKFLNESKKGWLTPKDLKTEVLLRNLFGTPAQKRKITAQMSLTPTFLAFKEFPGVNFVDPLRAKTSFEEPLDPQETSAEGKAEFLLDLEKFSNATYHLNILFRGFEAEGGRFVSSELATTVSPLDYLVGIKPLGDLRYIRKDSEQSIEILAISPNLEKLAVQDLNISQVELRWVSVLVKQSNGLFAYQSVLKEIPIASTPLALSQNGENYPLDTKKPGNFALVIRDKDNTELNRVAYTIAGDADIPGSLEGNAELEIKLDKSEYLPGEELELQIRAPYTGAGLITIEKDRVYNYRWFKTDKTNTLQKIAVPKDLEGNGYVNVSFVRALDSKEIFLSPLSYGVAPFTISRKPRTNALTILAPELVKPGEILNISVKAAKPSRAAVFLVDEGILQVSRYQTPDPLDHFYKKRALEVDTLQILDLLIPEFSIQQALSAPGGDGEGMLKHLNPFKRKRDKPVLHWFGIKEIGPESKDFFYEVPDYFNGTIRAMVVAVSDSFIGNADKKVAVRGDFVITPNIPAAVSPGDEFEVSASVTNSLEGSGKDAKVSLELTSDSHIEILGSAKLDTTIAEGDEGVFRFKLRSKDELGSAPLRFQAGIGDTKASLGSDLVVRPPVPLITTLKSGASTSGSFEVDLTRRSVYPFNAKYDGSVSPLPLGFAHGLMRFLDGYPYGCTEQVLSKAVPTLVFRSQPELWNVDLKKSDRQLSAAFRVLASRQNSDGAISVWYPGGDVSNEINAYVGLFLIEAKELGLVVPGNLYSDLLRHLRSIANRTPENFHEARTGAYATYLLTRTGVVTTSYLTALRGWFDNYEKNRPQIQSGVPYENWKKDIAAAFIASTYKLLKEDAEAQRLFGQVSLIQPVVPNYYYYHDRFVHGSLYLYLASHHFPETTKDLAPKTLLNYLDPLVNGKYSTLSSGYALFALDAYVRKVAALTQESFSVFQLQSDGKEEAVILPKSSLYPNFSIADETTKLKIASAGFLFYQLYQEGYDRELPKEPIKNGLEVYREFQNEAGKIVSEVKLGDKVTVVLRMRALTDLPIPNAVIVDMLPGGFEVQMSPNRFPVSNQTPASDSALWGFGVQGSTFAPTYADVREDRVLLFGTIPNDQAVEFRYHLTPTNKGTFVVPPLFGESMYDRSITAVYPGGSISNVAPPD